MVQTIWLLVTLRYITHNKPLQRAGISTAKERAGIPTVLGVLCATDHGEIHFVFNKWLAVCVVCNNVPFILQMIQTRQTMLVIGNRRIM